MGRERRKDRVREVEWWRGRDYAAEKEKWKSRGEGGEEWREREQSRRKTKKRRRGRVVERGEKEISREI